MEEGDVVHAGRKIRKETGDPLTALPVLLELPFRLDGAPPVAVSAAPGRLDLDSLVSPAVHGGLVVEGVNVARPAVHIEEDGALGFWREVRLLRRKRILPLRHP